MCPSPSRAELGHRRAMCGCFSVSLLCGTLMSRHIRAFCGSWHRANHPVGCRAAGKPAALDASSYLHYTLTSVRVKDKACIYNDLRLTPGIDCTEGHYRGKERGNRRSGGRLALWGRYALARGDIGIAAGATPDLRRGLGNRAKTSASASSQS
jgi:hypothetical protein